MGRVLRILLTLAAICALAPIPATAQVTAGSITGAVSDNTGAVMPGVTVTVTGERLMSPQMQVSDPTGHYRFDRLPPGTYDLKLELEGFKTAERKGINVSAMFTATVNVQ